MKSLHLAYKEYGEDIKEFQWLIFLFNKTGRTEYPYHSKLDPFISMGWLTRVGDLVSLGSENSLLIDQVYEIIESKPIVRPRMVTRQKDTQVRDYLSQVFKLPADFGINSKYAWQLGGLCSKFGKTLVMAVAAWYDSNRDQLPKQYRELRYEQFMHHGLFQALNTWMTDGVPAMKDNEELDFRNRVC